MPFPPCNRHIYPHYHIQFITLPLPQSITSPILSTANHLLLREARSPTATTTAITTKRARKKFFCSIILSSSNTSNNALPHFNLLPYIYYVRFFPHFAIFANCDYLYKTNSVHRCKQQCASPNLFYASVLVNIYGKVV